MISSLKADSFNLIIYRSLMLRALAGTFYDAALAVLYPRACGVCGACVESQTDGAACKRCWAEARIFSSADVLCWKCGAPATGALSEEKREEVFCRRCNAESFTAARAVGVYEGALRASVIALKREPFVPENRRPRRRVKTAQWSRANAAVMLRTSGRK